ncbi:MAG: alpha-mannosidase [Candidatus Thorarchaeota archaeon]
MGLRWIVNLCPFLHFDNSRIKDYEHNISIASWNIKSILDFLEVDDTHKFCIEQATLLEGFKRLFPNYWDALHQRILEGRVEIVGGTYVQPDFVIPDGESIARQFLYGVRFFHNAFGIEVKTGWAIDTSGHCAQMPQILRQSGMDTYFIWRGMPFDAPSEFIWKGPDGSRVNVVWLTAGYECASWLSENMREAFTMMLGIVEDINKRASSQNVFIPIGGELVPPAPHLADIVREWNRTFPDMRAVIVTPREYAEKLKTVQSGFATITENLTAGRFVPVRLGGLSSRIGLKIMNRRLETLLYLTELYLALKGNVEHNNALNDLWRIMLFNQDHNIIRGVIGDGPYKLAIKRFEKAIEQTERLLETAITDYSADLKTANEGVSIAVFNPLPWNREGIVRVAIDLSGLNSEYFMVKTENDEADEDEEEEGLPYQILERGDDGIVDMLFIAKDVPSMGHKVFKIVPSEKPPEFESFIKTGNSWIESERYAIEFDLFSGAITRIFDKKHHFEALREEGNYLHIENDVGDLYRYSRSELASPNADLTTLRMSGNVKIIESGPIRAIVEITGDVAESKRTQRVSLYHGLDRIDFETTLDFRGQDKRVSVVFPLTIFAERVTVGAQFGTEERLTVRDESDWTEPAKGTFAALDWVDCSGPDNGVAVATFGTHEFSFTDGILRMTLLRSVDHLSRGIDDDVTEAKTALENGQHLFRYALMPHAGNWRDAKIWRRATEHRIPLIAIPLDSAGTEPATRSALTIEDMDLAVSSLRPGENPNEIILRLYEPEGIAGTATLRFDRPIERAQLVDIIEREIGDIPSNGNSCTIQIDAHAIITLKIQFKSY